MFFQTATRSGDESTPNGHKQTDERSIQQIFSERIRKGTSKEYQDFTEYVESFRKPAYYYGIKPLEFSEMTCKEIGEYVEQQQEKERADATVISSIGYRLGELLICSNSLSVKKPRVIEYSKLFPEFNERIQSSNNTEETIEAKWREFLGVVR